MIIVLPLPTRWQAFSSGSVPPIITVECYGNTQQQKDANLKALIERNHYEKYYYLGDTQGDYNACRKAGVPFLFAAYGFGTVDADVPQVESLEQLPEIIKNL